MSDTMLLWRAIRRAGLLAPIFALLGLTGCAGTSPYTTAPSYETALIPGTDVWVVWTSSESVERLDYHQATNPAVPVADSVRDEDGGNHASSLLDSLPGPETFVPVQEVPKAIVPITPRHPVEAEGREGIVWIKALVLNDGLVARALVAKDSGRDCGFERAALEAAIQNVYSPAVYNGQPVAVWVTYPVDFRSDD